jgi:hypothetical protein
MRHLRRIRKGRTKYWIYQQSRQQGQGIGKAALGTRAAGVDLTPFALHLARAGPQSNYAPGEFQRGALRISACIEDPVVIEKILAHLEARA